jgi:hypothetical protein
MSIELIFAVAPADKDHEAQRERFANALLTSIDGAGCGPTFSLREKLPRSGG